MGNLKYEIAKSLLDGGVGATKAVRIAAEAVEKARTCPPRRRHLTWSFEGRKLLLKSAEKITREEARGRCSEFIARKRVEGEYAFVRLTANEFGYIAEFRDTTPTEAQKASKWLTKNEKNEKNKKKKLNELDELVAKMSPEEIKLLKKALRI